MSAARPAVRMAQVLAGCGRVPAAANRGARKQVRYHGEALSAEEVARLRVLGYAVPEREGH